MRRSKLSTSTAYPFICSFNGSAINAQVGLKVNSTLKRFVIAQIGTTAAALFENDFINYDKGFILVQNTEILLNKIFLSAASASSGPSGPAGSSGSTATPPNIINTISFTSVKMPSTFKNQKGNLSKDYEYGEKLMVSVSLETLEDEGTMKPAGAGEARGPIKNKKRGVLFLTYRDSNMSGRTLKSQSGGGGIGVWS